MLMVADHPNSHALRREFVEAGMFIFCLCYRRLWMRRGADHCSVFPPLQVSRFGAVRGAGILLGMANYQPEHRCDVVVGNVYSL